MSLSLISCMKVRERLKKIFKFSTTVFMHKLEFHPSNLARVWPTTVNGLDLRFSYTNSCTSFIPNPNLSDYPNLNSNPLGSFALLVLWITMDLVG